MPGEPKSRCDDCGGEARFAPLFARGDLVRCAACGAWAYRGPTPSDPASLYDEAYFNGAEYSDYAAGAASQRLNFRRKLQVVLRHGGLRAGDARMLELGCATGEFLSVAAEAGVPRLLGIEPSAYCRDIAARRGLEVLSPADPGKDAAIAALRPNVVVAWDVWEHLPRPAGVFEDVLSRCARDVTVAISTVDAASLVARARRTRWRQFHPPTHLHYPTRRSFELFFASRGLRVAHHGSFGDYRPLLEYARALGVRPRRARGPGLPWSIPLYLNLGDIQLVVGRRNDA
ncbi:MAG TPA: class I SAM-dependent methyltransferase [Anaeromyxobacter sp.]